MRTGNTESEREPMLHFDREKVLANVRAATTEDLLDRVPVFRDGMEPEPVHLIERELHERGVTAAEIDAHAAGRANSLTHDDGLAARCSFCDRPAVQRGWSWGRPAGRGFFRFLSLPFLPLPVYRCEAH